MRTWAEQNNNKNNIKNNKKKKYSKDMLKHTPSLYMERGYYSRILWNNSRDGMRWKWDKGFLQEQLQFNHVWSIIIDDELPWCPGMNGVYVAHMSLTHYVCLNMNMVSVSANLGPVPSLCACHSLLENYITDNKWANDKSTSTLYKF